MGLRVAGAETKQKHAFLVIVTSTSTCTLYSQSDIFYYSTKQYFVIHLTTIDDCNVIFGATSQLCRYMIAAPAETICEIVTKLVK